MGNQVRYFVGDGLLEEVFAVFTVQLRVEAQQVFIQVGDAGLLADLRPPAWVFLAGVKVPLSSSDLRRAAGKA